jgi:hypothetical protein
MRCKDRGDGFGSLAPVTVAQLCDKFKTYGTVQNVIKGCCVETLLQTFTQSLRESVRQCSCETSV